MGFRLRGDISFCVAEGRAIFLDLARDRYFALPRRADAAFQKLLRGELEPGDLLALEALVRDDILQEAAGSAVPLAAYHRVPSASLANDRCSPSVLEVGATLVAQAAMIARLKVSHLLAIVERIRRRKAFDDAAPSGSLGDDHRAVVAAVWRAERLFSSSDRCLPRSLALMQRLLARDCPVELVFGVRVIPFAAHCWLQHRDIVLDDTIEHVRLFKPILVV